MGREESIRLLSHIGVDTPTKAETVIVWDRPINRRQSGHKLLAKCESARS